MLCQPPAFKNIILATTKWSDIQEDVGRRREEELKSKHWTVSDVVPFDNTFKSAWTIVDRIFEKGPVDATLFRQELIHLKDRLSSQAPSGISANLFLFLVQALRAIFPPDFTHLSLAVTGPSKTSNGKLSKMHTVGEGKPARDFTKEDIIIP
jgi:hypothetical protein